MAQSVTVWHNGTASLVTPSCGNPAQRGTLNTTFFASFTGSKSTQLSVVGATRVDPFVLSLDSIENVRFLGVRVVNGASIQVVVTTAAGEETYNVSPLLLLFAQNPGDEITAISLVGTADLEVMIAGDVAT